MNIISAILAYLIGTIPVAWLLVRSKSGKNILEEGSGNPGALNAFEVTGSRNTGIIVMLLDAAKGAGAVLLALLLTGDFYGISVAAVLVVLGHCFNVFFGGKGGRGLATAAGAVAVINPLGLIFWLLMWLTGYFAIRRDVHVGNMAGTLGAPMLLYSTPDQILNALAVVPGFHVQQYKWTIFLICLQIFFRHLQPLRELFQKDAEEESPPNQD